MKNAEMEIIRFDAQDVITTSGGGSLTGWFQVTQSLYNPGVGVDMYYQYPDGKSVEWQWNSYGDCLTFSIEESDTSAGINNFYWQVTKGESRTSGKIEPNEFFYVEKATKLDGPGNPAEELKSLMEIYNYLKQ